MNHFELEVVVSFAWFQSALNSYFQLRLIPDSVFQVLVPFHDLQLSAVYLFSLVLKKSSLLVLLLLPQTVDYLLTVLDKEVTVGRGVEHQVGRLTGSAQKNQILFVLEILLGDDVAGVV